MDTVAVFGERVYRIKTIYNHENIMLTKWILYGIEFIQNIQCLYHSHKNAMNFMAINCELDHVIAMHMHLI